AYLACTATLTRVLLDPNGAPLDVGRAHRLATPAQRKALAARDGGCVIPACPVPHEGTDAHHLHAWEHGGRTDLHNLVSLCPNHHQQVHAGLWVIELLDGIPWVRPPSWIDPERRRTRNLHHQTHAAAQRIGQQLRLALDEDADARGVGPSRTGLTPIDLTPPIWNQAPPDDTWKRTA
uniref:HNH endonuclease signature motif containing protein n=1 Tax=Kineosporia sp. R_H_3 TaxID=1961848 RepID=UPI001179C001